MNKLNLLLIIISFMLIGMGLSSKLLSKDGPPGGVFSDQAGTMFAIWTKADLDSVAVAVNDPNNWWKSSGKTFTLHTNLSGFTGTIGTSNSPFKGTFNGWGHRIDVTINKSGSGYLGLFGYAENALIKNLTVTGSVTGSGYVGGIVGYGANVWIENCTNLASVTAKNPYDLPPLQPDPPFYTTYIVGGPTFSGDYVGGIAGYCYKNSITIVKLLWNVQMQGTYQVLAM